jgi:zinc transporter ZupT
VYRFTSIVATALSSLLPVLAIVILYIVQNMPARLGIIAGFTAGFSFLLSLITNADRVANFSATAA